MKTTNQTGSTLIFSMLLLGVMLLVALTLAGVFVPKINLSTKAKSSVGALYAAESAVEWCLYVAKVDSGATPPVLTNGASYTDNTEQPLTSASCVTPLRVIGSYQGVSRALEVGF